MYKYLIQCPDGLIETTTSTLSTIPNIDKILNNDLSQPNINTVLEYRTVMSILDNGNYDLDNIQRDTIDINVRGKHFKIFVSILKCLKYFEPMISGRWTLNEFFLDINPTAFENIILFIENPCIDTINKLSQWHKEIDMLCLGFDGVIIKSKLQNIIDESSINNYIRLSSNHTTDYDKKSKNINFAIPSDIKFVTGIYLKFYFAKHAVCSGCGRSMHFCTPNKWINDPTTTIIDNIEIYSGTTLITCYFPIESMRKCTLINFKDKSLIIIPFNYLTEKTKDKIIINHDLNFIINVRPIKYVSDCNKNLCTINFNKLDVVINHIIFKSVYHQLIINKKTKTKIQNYQAIKYYNLKSDTTVLITKNVSCIYIYFDKNDIYLNSLQLLNNVKIYVESDAEILLLTTIQCYTMAGSKNDEFFLSYDFDEKMRCLNITHMTIEFNDINYDITTNVICESDSILIQKYNMIKIKNCTE